MTAPPLAQTLLGLAIRDLTAAGIPGAAQDGRALLAHALGIPRDRLTLYLIDPVPQSAADRFGGLIGRRIAREPVARILGERQFYGRQFRVTPDVLDPRPETETLIEAALAVPFDTVLDLGTGSGAILATLLAERPTAHGTGTDLSHAALDVAQANTQACGAAQRATFLPSDWFATVQGRFDLIVSNPPYIAAAEMAGLEAEVRDHDPAMALTDGADGLTAYRAITAGAIPHLTADGWLMVEIGPTQGQAVHDLFAASGFGAITLRPDLDGRDRVVLGQAPRNPA